MELILYIVLVYYYCFLNDFEVKLNLMYENLLKLWCYFNKCIGIKGWVLGFINFNYVIG